MKRLLITYLLTFAAIATMLAAKPIDEAKTLFNKGEYAEAAAKLRAIVKQQPKDGTANYWLGRAYLALDQLGAARAPLEKAVEHGVADASRLLAVIALDEYDVRQATRYIDSWERQLHKDRMAIPEELSAMRTKAVKMANMLERVERIAVVDSVVVDSADFFRAYPLPQSSGLLLEGSALPPQYQRPAPRVVFRPEIATQVMWAMPDDKGNLALVSADILDDGTMEQPEYFGREYTEGANADYPFMMPDGATLYFAADGDDSIGGYDIFMTRCNPDGTIMMPQNVGMPYNSLYDDYMLVIDETNNIGWWATDRNRIPGKVTIYTFIPNATRVNHDPSEPNIVRYAKVTGSWIEQPMMHRSATNAAATIDASAQFVVSMGNGKIYTSLEDFQSEQAREQMRQYIDRHSEMRQMQARLSALRGAYREGDVSVGDEILTLERRINAARPMLKKLQNAAIRQEQL